MERRDSMSMGIGIQGGVRTVADFLWQYGNKHITTNEAYALLQKSEPGIGKATIYRMYHLLMVLGFVQGLEVGDGLFWYEICSQNSRVPTHHHFICSECGSVQGVREDMLDEMERQIEEKYGFTVEDHRVLFLAAVKTAKPENTEANKCKKVSHWKLIFISSRIILQMHPQRFLIFSLRPSRREAGKSTGKPIGMARALCFLWPAAPDIP